MAHLTKGGYKPIYTLKPSQAEGRAGQDRAGQGGVGRGRAGSFWLEESSGSQYREAILDIGHVH